MSYIPGNNRITQTGVTSASSSIVLPANAILQNIIVNNTTANAVSGGLKIGSTSGAADIMTSLSVPASIQVVNIPSALLKAFFSATNPQTLFIDAVIGWNSANVTITILYYQL